jgi:molybdopterin synthase catalytic subunit
MVAIRIAVQRDDFDIAGEVRRLAGSDARDIGAIVTFSGICRDENGRLAALELEHYPGMAEEEIGRIAAEAASRWPLAAITVVHRSGRLLPGENIVLVATASAHRKAAFAAAAFLMDYLKTRAPFWKKEHAASGKDGWVAATASDDRAADRWALPEQTGGAEGKPRQAPKDERKRATTARRTASKNESKRSERQP